VLQLRRPRDMACHVCKIIACVPCFALADEAFKSWLQCDDHHSAMKNWESRGVNTNLDSQDFGALQLHQRLSSQVSRGPHLVCAQAMRDQPSGQRPSSSRAGRGQTRWRSAPATTPAPGLRRDELKLLDGAACASLARCAHSLTSACHHALLDRPAIAALARVDNLEIAHQAVRITGHRNTASDGGQ
jgi:hypothetical protein